MTKQDECKHVWESVELTAVKKSGEEFEIETPVYLCDICGLVEFFDPNEEVNAHGPAH